MLGGIKLNIIVTSFQSLDFKSQLLKNFKENYLTQLDNMDEVRFVSLPELCSGLLNIALNKELKMPANLLQHINYNRRVLSMHRASKQKFGTNYLFEEQGTSEGSGLPNTS